MTHKFRAEAFLPLITYPDANSDRIAANAVRTAALLDANIHAIAINADIPPITNSMSRFLLNIPELIRKAEALSRKRGDHLIAAVSQEAERQGIEISTETVSCKVPRLADFATINARYFDWVICGWEAPNPASAQLAETIIFGSGRPTCLLPELTAVNKFDHVAVAWDGSRAAARTLSDAQWILSRASNITILTVLGERPLHHADAERLASSLRRRGLAAQASPIAYRGVGIGALLQEEAAEAGADLLIMGAYGHSRARQFFLGGATKDVLDDLRLPVLMSH